MKTQQPLWGWGIPLLALVCSAAPLLARADCGSVPFRKVITENPVQVVRRPGNLPTSAVTSPELSPVIFPAGAGAPGQAEGPLSVEFDPLKVTVFEPRQRAILLWNGHEEILYLSTDQSASQPSSILEVIPLPSKPEVRLGSFETFERAQRLAVEKRMWACAHGGARAGAAPLPANAGRIHFAQRMGAHDLAVAEVLDREGFVAFVQDYLEEKYAIAQAPIRTEFADMIETYLDGGFRWFVFDVIDLADSTQSRQPIEYRFASEEVFYPMRISTLERGDTTVDLLVFSTTGPRNFTGLDRKEVKLKPLVQVKREEALALDEGWKDFFPESQPDLFMDQWTVEGDISRFTQDIRVK